MTGRARPRHSLALAAVLTGIFLAAPARASVHLWEITEVYSNAEGTIQYVELSTSTDFQTMTGGVTFRSLSNGVLFNTFTIPSNLGSTSTAGTTFLLATPGFQAVSGIAPDFVLPCVPFFDPNASSITVELLSMADSLPFTSADLPSGSGDALYATVGGMLSTGTATPKNFAGSTGSMTAPCLAAGSCDPCNDALFCTDACIAGTCNGAFVRCPGQVCDEARDLCVDCFGAGDCNDSNPCTDDACVSDACQHTNNTGACDDGLFCTGTDACSGGACVHGGDPCAPQNCREGDDSCGACLNAGDCDDGNECTTDTCTGGDCAQADVADGTPCDDDGLFCTGDEVCASGACASEGDPCAAAAGTTCDEAADLCDAGNVSTDGGVSSGGSGAGTGATGGGDEDGGSARDGAVGSGSTAGGDGGATTGGTHGARDASTDGGGGAANGGGSDGCSCRAAGGDTSGPENAWPLAAALVLLTLRRRIR